MKICFVLEYYYPHIGGAETFFKNLAERLVKNGHECHVITSRISKNSKCERINGVYIHRVDIPRWLDRYWFAILSIPTVYRIAKNCDILHTRTYSGAFPAFLIAKLLRKPAVITVFEVLLSLWKTLSGMNWFNARLHALLEKAVITLPFDKYACISYYTRNYIRLLGISDRKLTMIYPGIDYDLFPRQRENSRLIREELGLKENFIYLYFGRPGFFKGVEFLLKAVPLISKIMPQSKLLLILSKEPRGKYKQALSIIKDLKIENSLILLETMHIENLVKYISCCDCVVLPSLTEGFGFTCIEACSVGKPVVATNVGAMPEVASGECVFIAPQSPEEICRGVELVYRGKTEFLLQKKFGWKECIQKYEAIYKSTV